MFKKLISKKAGVGVVLATGGKFHAFRLAQEYERAGALKKLFVAHRTIFAPSGVAQSHYVNRLDLAYWHHLHRLINVGYSEHRKNRIFENWLTPKLSKITPGVLHAWSGIAHGPFKKLAGTQWLRCLERSCPHNMFQYELLKEEADLLKLPFLLDRAPVERAVEELYMADVIVVPSRYAAASYSDPALIKKVKINTLGANFPIHERDRHNGKLRILLVGNSFFRKGIHYLIEAFKLIDDPDAELWLRGGIPDAYRKTIVDPRIKVIGNLFPSQLHALYKSATVFVQPSIDEGFGMTVLEALAYGLPLVITENVGARDILTDEVAIAVPIRDAEALARGILAARHLPGAAFDEARRHILEVNSWAACAERMLTQVYRRPNGL